MSRRIRGAIALGCAMAMMTTGLASAHHPDHAEGTFGGEQFPGEGVFVEGDKQQHGGDEGHLAPRNDNIEVIGHGRVRAPRGSVNDLTGRVADVAAHGNYAYLTAFRSPDCLGGGAWVMDIKNPRAPHQVNFLPTTDGSYAGEGAQVFVPEYGTHVGTPLFIHQNETCNAALANRPAPNLGGFNIWDVSDPRNAEQLVAHAGDFTNPFTGETRTSPATVHSMFAWNSHVDERAYVVLVDNEEFTDVDIMDITDPANPEMVNDSLDLVDLFQVDQDDPAGLTSVFNHDMMVYRHGDRYVMNVNYWDGGYVLLDVTDPLEVELIAETDFAEFDEERAARGHFISPEGNAHQSEISPDFGYMIGTDEDFSPFRVSATIDDGTEEGIPFTAIPAGDAAPIPSGETAGEPTFVGLACDPIPAGEGIALIERGVCAFQVKLDNAVAAGYTTGIVFNNAGGCDGLVNMLAEGDIPFLFVSRTTGLQMLNAPSLDCATPTPDVGTPVNGLTITSIFDGWGYVRLFELGVSTSPGTSGSITQLDTYAVPESQDAAFADGFGDLSVHEVAMDPTPGSNLAYISYYAAGVRVVEYGEDGITEVGSFIDRGGNNFWGVEVHQHPNGQQYVLASDRDSGLYILQYDAADPLPPHTPAVPTPGNSPGPGGPARP